jgi:hypothetical protein
MAPQYHCKQEAFMSDTFYREQAARQNRITTLIVIGLATVACLVLFGIRSFQDNCTGSFDRTPESVIASYIEHITNRSAEATRRCWKDEAYFSLETGCSEICISRLFGTSYEIIDLHLEPELINAANRAEILAEVTISCTDGTQHTGQIVLDGVPRDVPWRHWKIVQSEIGGPLGESWCR